ncbi:MAG TPA: 5-oxoprolinase subunit PxpB [Longimicrobium sp.]|nr:5-oxoprolinase subunit PxpB [Longimicrobium sp.]
MRIEPLGDGAVQIVLGDAPDEPTRRRVAAASRRLAGSGLPGLLECVPGFTSLTIHYDPVRLSPSAEGWLDSSLPQLLAGLDERAGDEGRLVEIPVCYGGELGPDLESVASLHGLTADEAVALHAAGDYRVHLVGFVPGFPYLGGLDARLATPRRESPRTAVPAGSVGIGGAQTGIYPVASPGGWQLIGRTPLRLFDAHRDPPALLRAGDRVRFVAVDAETFRGLEGT